MKLINKKDPSGRQADSNNAVALLRNQVHLEENRKIA